MGKIEAYSHIQNREHVNCATVALHTLLPFSPEPESITALFDNTDNLIDIVHVLGHELAKNNWIIQPIIMRSDVRPSIFFQSVHHNLKHGNKWVQFIGGLMATQEEDSQHVITIDRFHNSKRPKFDIMDTNPHNPNKRFYRRVSGNFLDRRINYEIAPEEPNAVAIAGMNRSIFETSDFYNSQMGYETDMLRLQFELNTYFLNQRARSNQN